MSDRRTVRDSAEPPDDRHAWKPDQWPNEPVSSPIVLSSVWKCRDLGQAEALLTGEQAGYVYRRDGHPNADRLAARCCELHQGHWAAITSSGMAAIAAVLLAELQAGDHLLIARELYGKTHELVLSEWQRLGVDSSIVDPESLASLDESRRQTTKILAVETISNPMLRVADLESLANWCQKHSIRLVVDNTFATPLLSQPLQAGADYVVESLTKFINGHSDVVAGLICGRGDLGERINQVISCWGLVSSPMDCWLAERGMATLEVRWDRAETNAAAAAKLLAASTSVTDVSYPGLIDHADHVLAKKQFNGRFGNMVTFRLQGGLEAVERFFKHIPFCPSLGELQTTASHPRSTSHRDLSSEECDRWGITDTTIRLSVGCEVEQEMCQQLQMAIRADA